MPQTDLELLAIILLSINAFSTEIVDCYFDGDEKCADPCVYILHLLENNGLPIGVLKKGLRAES